MVDIKQPREVGYGSRAPQPAGSSVGQHTVPGATPDRPKSATNLPRVDFDAPPVVETFLGVQFQPVPGLTLTHFGLFWGTMRNQYPTQEVKPPLPPVVEEFVSPPQPRAVGIQLTAEPDARCWFVDETSTQLIQVQRDRFIRNWRKGAPPNDRYPRYDDLRPKFEHDWQSFLNFLRNERLDAPEVNQCEVTYINHIELGRGWQALGELHKITPIVSEGQRRFLPSPELHSLNVSYVMPDNLGRLHVSAQPAIRRQDAKVGIQLTLTARGKPVSSEISDIIAWFNLGHDWIVHGFVDMTTREMRNIWEQR